MCVNSCWVPFCCDTLRQLQPDAAVMQPDATPHKVRVCTVVGFPLGQMAPAAKAFEAQSAAAQGASEVDMVLNVGWLKGGEYVLVYEDIKAVVEAVPKSVMVKVCCTGRGAQCTGRRGAYVRGCAVGAHVCVPLCSTNACATFGCSWCAGSRVGVL